MRVKLTEIAKLYRKEQYQQFQQELRRYLVTDFNQSYRYIESRLEAKQAHVDLAQRLLNYCKNINQKSETPLWIKIAQKNIEKLRNNLLTPVVVPPLVDVPLDDTQANEAPSRRSPRAPKAKVFFNPRNYQVLTPRGSNNEHNKPSCLSSFVGWLKNNQVGAFFATYIFSTGSWFLFNNQVLGLALLESAGIALVGTALISLLVATIALVIYSCYLLYCAYSDTSTSMAHQSPFNSYEQLGLDDDYTLASNNTPAPPSASRTVDDDSQPGSPLVKAF